MTLFNYTGVDAEGKPVKGVLESENQFTVAHELKAQHIDVLTAEPVAAKSKGINIPFLQRVKMHEKIILANNLATMLRAGLALSRALAILTHQARNPALKRTLEGLNEGIKKGDSFKDSLKKYPKVFSVLFVAMVAAGEESGKLADSLDVVASQMEKSYTLQKKIRGAMMYPSVIVFAMLVIGIFMLVTVVPTLIGVFTDLGVDLPLSTRMIIWVSDFAQNNGFILFLGIVGAIAALAYGLRTKRGKRMRDGLWLRLPLIAPLYKETIAARTTRTLSSLLASGVPIVQALTIVEETMINSYYKEVLQKAQKNVQLGTPMSAVFIEAERLYPIFVGEMIAVGEETGELGHMLFSVAEFYEEEVDQKTKDMSTIIEPVLMLLVGGAVAFFAISMISPMYSLVDNI